MNKKAKLWLELGVYGSNNLRYVNASQLHYHLGAPLCRSLIAFHTLTGDDYLSAFNRRGKITPFKVLEKHPEIQAALSQLGKNEAINESEFKMIEKLCLFYGSKRIESVDDLRFELFVKKYKNKKVEF